MATLDTLIQFPSDAAFEYVERCLADSYRRGEVPLNVVQVHDEITFTFMRNDPAETMAQALVIYNDYGMDKPMRECLKRMLMLDKWVHFRCIGR